MSMRITLSADERFLEVDFDGPQRTLSWAVVGGGYGVHRRVVWHFVTRAELSAEIDPVVMFRERLQERGYEAAVGLLTARYLRPYVERTARFGECEGRAVVTSGLGNALRAGDPPTHTSIATPAASTTQTVGKPATVGTINVLCHVSVPLSDAAMLEALALASEARTAAMLEFRHPSVVSDKPATGTGTDCIVIASPCEGTLHDYAGKHTEVGAVVGESVYEATRHATAVWLSEQAQQKNS
jgi:adenosylcobinamide amidohydrolase